MSEKTAKTTSGYLMLVVGIVVLLGAIGLMIWGTNSGQNWLAGPFVLLLIIGIFLLVGCSLSIPMKLKLWSFLGIMPEPCGRVDSSGLIHFGSKRKISLRARNLSGQKLKVNDKLGNPIEIAAVMVWQVDETFKAAFEVDNYEQYVVIQSEAAVRHLAQSYPYDSFEDAGSGEVMTLRASTDKMSDFLVAELTNRLSRAGVKIIEARLSHLAYAPEIAEAMLRRQQASAVVAARTQIVYGAVSMVEMALKQLSEKHLVDLDEERRAAMVSNLLVVLCSESAASPVINAGTLYQ